MTETTCTRNKDSKCPCTYSCRQHGKCCDCVAYHRKQDGFPACFFSETAEKTYDRSFAALCRDREDK